VEVLLCIDPIVNIKDNLPALRAEAGSYSGTVYIDDPRVTGGSVSYTVNLKYHRIYLVLLVVLVAGVLGSVVGLALSSGAAWHSLGRNFDRTLAVLVGSVTAVYVVYVAQYDSDPSWQGSTSLFTALFATTLGAAYTATNVAGTAQLGRASDRGRAPWVTGVDTGTGVPTTQDTAGGTRGPSSSVGTQQTHTPATSDHVGVDGPPQRSTDVPGA
jgi:hypothetical protein